MKIVRIFCLLLLSAAAVTRWAVPREPPPGSIERLSPEIDQLVPPGAEIERVGTDPGFKWTEGPVWIPAGYLLFAEIPSNSIRKWMPRGGLSIFLQPSGYKGAAPFGGPEPGSNGMTLDARGRLTVAGHARRNVWRLESLNFRQTIAISTSASNQRTFTEESPPEITVLADTYRGKRLNSPNDLVYSSDGSLYFTDPPYGLPTQSDRDPAKELAFSGVYRIPRALAQPPAAAPQRDSLELLIKDLPRPNGIAFSPDEKFLYVDNSEPKKLWMRYAVNADGTLAPGTLFYDATSDPAPGAPDGMKVDRQGNLYTAGPGGVWIFSPDAKHLGTLHMPERTSNLAWGDTDAKTLYITASSSIYRIRLAVSGIRP